MWLKKRKCLTVLKPRRLKPRCWDNWFQDSPRAAGGSLAIFAIPWLVRASLSPISCSVVASLCVCVRMSECPLSIRTPVSHTGQGPNHSLVLTCSSAKISLPNKATFTDAGGQDFISHGELATEGRHNSTHKIWLKGFLCSPSVGGLGSTGCGVRWPGRKLSLTVCVSVGKVPALLPYQ